MKDSETSIRHEFVTISLRREGVIDFCDLSFFKLSLLGKEGGGNLKYAWCHPFYRFFFLRSSLKDPTMSWHKRLVPCTGCTAYSFCLHALCMGGATSCWTLETLEDGCLKGFEWTRSCEDFKTICKLTGIRAVCKLRGAKAAAEMLMIVCSHPLHRCS